MKETSMNQTKIARSVAVAGLFHANYPRRISSILPGLALFMLTTAWGQTPLSLRAPRVPPNREGAVQHAGTAQQTRPAPDTPASARYRFITIDIPGSAGADAALQINDLNVVTGIYLDSSSNWHGFVWWNGILRTFEEPNSLDTQLGATNNRGVGIGNYGDLNTQHAAVYTFWSDLWAPLPDIPGKPLNFGFGINASGVLVGAAGEGDVNTFTHNIPWIWDPIERTYSYLSVPGANDDFGAQAYTINDKGQIIGGFYDANGHAHGFIKNRQGYTIINVPRAAETGGSGINDRGTAVAGWADDADVEHGYVRTADGVYTILDFPGAVQSAPFGINNHDNLCGFWLDADGVSHAWVGFRF